MKVFGTPHTGRMPGAFYWIFGVSLLVTGGPFVLLFFGAPHPVKYINMFVLGPVFLGMMGLMWYYQRSFDRLSYELTETGIVINWGKNPTVISYEDIRAVSPGKLKGASRIYGLEIGGYRQGLFSVYRLGKGQFYAVGDQVVFIQTEENLYCISPADHEDFVGTLREKLRQQGVSYSEQVTKQQGKTKSGSFLDGWSLAGIILGIVMILGMVLLIYLLIPRLPERIPMHYNWRGEVDGYGSPEGLYIMPGLALVCWFPTVIIGIALADGNARTRRLVVAVGGGTVLLVWGILLAMVLPLL
ncbi:MAG: DUF1648 domain-containing protein [Clostridia bacterium]|nr:DUF1648 domain-containing protein [Clostridia bacterium]